MIGAGIAASLILSIWLVTAGCGPDSETREAVVGATEPEDALGRARSSADALGQRLMEALGEQLGNDGPAAAINVCSEIAPAAASEISGEGLEIRRTSLRYRNPENAPDAWELAWLKQFEEKLVGGELPADVHEIDDARGELRYLRPIVMGTGCLLCHGAADQLDGEIKRQLADRYPQDRATGYALGDVRGAFSVRVQLQDPGPG